MEIEKRYLKNEGMTIRYTLMIKKVKNITLKINDQGELIVTCNAYIPLPKIEEFVKEKVGWIIDKQEKIIENSSRYYDDCMVQDYFYLFDLKLKIVRIQSNQNKVQHDQENLYIYYIKEEDAHKNVIRFIKKECESEYKYVVNDYYEKLKDYRFPYPEIKYRSMKSRWGSCTPSKHLICLNTKMIHYPKAFLEYVVLHELVHFVQPNHSDSFYKIIQFHMHDYKQRIQLTK